MTQRRYQARAWYVRADRNPQTGETTARVTEEYRLQGNTPDRPVDALRPVDQIGERQTEQRPHLGARPVVADATGSISPRFASESAVATQA